MSSSKCSVASVFNGSLFGDEDIYKLYILSFPDKLLLVTLKAFNIKHLIAEFPVSSALSRLDRCDVWRGRGGDVGLDSGDAHGRGEGPSADGRPAGEEAIQEFFPLSH